MLTNIINITNKVKSFSLFDEHLIVLYKMAPHVRHIKSLVFDHLFCLLLHLSDPKYLFIGYDTPVSLCALIYIIERILITNFHSNPQLIAHIVSKSYLFKRISNLYIDDMSLAHVREHSTFPPELDVKFAKLRTSISTDLGTSVKSVSTNSKLGSEKK